jgi:hypothetical protein
MQDRLVFLIGSPRSGSTLLSRLLDAHSAIFAPEEPHLITPLAHLGYFESVDEAPYDPIITRQAARALVAALPGGEQAYLNALRSYCDAIYAGLLEGSGEHATLLLDKTPAYALSLDFLARLYPQARYLVLTRHPIAVWSSFVDSFFDGDDRVAHEHNPLLERYVPAIARFLRTASVPMHRVHYESLVEDPDATSREICSFLGIEFEPGMEAGASRPLPRDPRATGRRGPRNLGLPAGGNPRGARPHRPRGQAWAPPPTDPLCTRASCAGRHSTPGAPGEHPRAADSQAARDLRRAAPLAERAPGIRTAGARGPDLLLF